MNRQTNLFLSLWRLPQGVGLKDGRPLVRAILVALIATCSMISTSPHSAQSVCEIQSGCATAGKFDIAFMLDRSGSVANRGQTWNLMVEGVLRVLRDPTVIPRDGSIAVCVVAFDGAASVTVPLTDINSADDAKKVADLVAALKCGSIRSQVFPCPFGETNWVSGILGASTNVGQARSAKPKPGARRIFYLVSDGSTTPIDLGQATELAEQTRTGAASSGISLMFDAFLMGVDPQQAEFTANKAALNQIVTPLSAKGSPGVTFVINPGACNLEGANGSTDDCNSQPNDFAEKTRGTLRSNIASLPLVVNTESDTLPGVLPTKGVISLRQAIEAANCNGGAGTITFSAGLSGKTIRPLVALPALTAPDISINGCDPAVLTGCTPLLTIDGGGQLADGISIRSNRDVVRGLRIINFTHAGVVIAPVCPSDNLGRNLVERNVLENNPTGILVFDQRSVPRDGFNERNTISRNSISRAAPASDSPPSALIDLGADGPTPNDTGDADQGPNTLVNFPDSLNVVSSGSGLVTITGQVSGPTAAGAIVELYAITSSHIVSGKVVIDGVTFLAQSVAGACPTAVAGASCFTATGVGISPGGSYTALVTDPLGNTSELMFRADGKPAAGPDASFNQTVDFGTVNLNSTPTQKQFDVINNGNAPLQITGCLNRRCAPADSDDSSRFSIAGCPNPTAQINPGERVTLTLSFATNVCGSAKSCLILTSNDLLHSPILSTLTGQVAGDLLPTVTLEANAASLIFGPQAARSQRRGINKLVKKAAFHTFTIDNRGCNTFGLSFNSIKRVTDVARCKITSPNADDSNLFLVTQFSGGTETPMFPAVSTGGTAIQIAPGQTLTFRVRFNPAVPPVVNKTCPDGTLIADDVLPNEISSVINILASRTGVSGAITVPLTGRVTSEVRVIDPVDATAPAIVAFCRSGNDFIAQFSLYDSNQNIDHASFQFTDSAGRTVGQVINVTGLDQAIAARNLAVGQSLTVVQRFTGAADNSQVTRVQVTVFDKDGNTDSAGSGPISASCSGVTAQAIVSVRNATLILPARAIDGRNQRARPNSSRRPE
jgi:hypothetical protein